MSFLLLAVAVALKQAVTPEFKLYQKEVIANAQVMGRELQAKGYKVVTGKFYWVKSYRPTDLSVRGKRFTVCTEIVINLGTIWFTIRGGRLRYKRYDAHILKKSSVELPFSSFDDHLINILRKVNRLIYAFKIN